MRATRASFATLTGLLAMVLAGPGCGGSDNGMMDMMGKGCEDGITASKNDFFPLIVGNVWQYLVTYEDQSTGMKRVELIEEMTPAGESAPVVVQRTTKPEGVTVSWLRQEGDRIIRLRQEDYDPSMVLERTTIYDPPVTRFDGSAASIAMDAMFSETYTRTVTDAASMQTVTTITDSTTVLGVDVECNAGWGKLTCLHIKETRVTGGVSSKDFFFARGYGKIVETGGQSEQLVGCTLK